MPARTCWVSTGSSVDPAMLQGPPSKLLLCWQSSAGVRALDSRMEVEQGMGRQGGCRESCPAGRVAWGGERHQDLTNRPDPNPHSLGCVSLLWAAWTYTCYLASTSPSRTIGLPGAYSRVWGLPFSVQVRIALN